MTNRMLGMFAASLLAMAACGGESDGVDDQGETEALTADDFDTAEHRVLADGGVADARGGRADRGDCRSAAGGRGSDPARAGGRDPARGGRAADDDDDADQDEAADEAAGGRRNKNAGGPDGGVRARSGRGRCVDGPSGDGGVRPRDPGRDVGRDGGVANGGRRDAGASAPATGGETITLADGSKVRLDPSCPSLTRSGVTLPGCCLPANTCGLSTHLFDVTGVPKGCQSYAQGRQVDPTFDLADKACTFRN